MPGLIEYASRPSRPTTPIRIPLQILADVALNASPIRQNHHYTSHSAYLSRDQRLQIHTLLSAGHSFMEVTQLLGISYRQVEYTANTVHVTPQKRKGRPSILSAAQVDQLIEFVCASKYNRRLPYYRIPEALGWDCSEYAVRYALRRHGFSRHPALRKPPISEPTRQKRLQFAIEHHDWTLDQWRHILWSDETWATAGNHRKVYVTRRSYEALDPTCILDRPRRRNGWMFWGSFSGIAGKGPSLFWEKSWGSISGASYREYILPLVDRWCQAHPGHIFVQDNASSHAARDTIHDLQERGIVTLQWPPYSPDLNLIEDAWNWMKDYIAWNFPEYMSYPRLRAAITEAWDAIPSEFFEQRIQTMTERLDAVIAANGMHTKF